MSLCFSDPGGIQGPDGALAEHAGSSQRHAEVQGDYTAGDPSGECELIVRACVHRRGVFTHARAREQY